MQIRAGDGKKYLLPAGLGGPADAVNLAPVSEGQLNNWGDLEYYFKDLVIKMSEQCSSWFLDHWVWLHYGEERGRPESISICWSVKDGSNNDLMSPRYVLISNL